MNFLGSISSVPGSLTIEYSSFEDLRNQLLLLAQTLDNRPEALPLQAETVSARRSASVETAASGRKAQSA